MKNRVITYIALSFYLLLGVLFFLFIQLRINPSLIYFTQQPSFLLSSSFFQSFLFKPGGLSLYMGNFIMQFFSIGWLGTILILITSFTIIIAGLMFWRRVTPSPQYPIIVPALGLAIIAMLLGSYLFHFAPLVSFLLALVAANVVGFFERKTKLGILFLFLLGFATYWMAGGMSFLLYSALLLLYFVFASGINQRVLKIVVTIIQAIAIPYLGFRFLSPIPITDSYFYFIPKAPILLTLEDPVWHNPLLVLFPALIIISLVLNKINPAILKSQPNDGLVASEKEQKKTSSFKNTLILGKMIVSIVVAILVCRYSYSNSIDELRRAISKADYHSHQQEWEKVIEVTTSYPTYDFFLNFHFNRANLHLGTLSYNAFRYPQLAGIESLLPDRILAGSITLPACDIYYDLGYMAASLVYAGEIQTLLPYSPRVLQRLFLINLVMGQYASAEIYLNTLEKTLFSRDFINQYKPLIKDKTLIEQEKGILYKREIMPQGGLVESTPEYKLRRMVLDNPNNSWAKEYLMMFHLLDHNLGAFVSLLNREYEKGLRSFPRLWQEAAILFSVMGGELNPEIQALIEPSVLNDFKRFSTVMTENMNDRNRAKRLLAQEFSQTYWYYVRFDSPKVTGAEIKRKVRD